MKKPSTRKPHKPPSILEAMDDTHLFAKWFSGSSWNAWRCFLKALFALPLTDDEMEVFRACTGRTLPPLVQCVYATLIIGRRGGKSRVLGLVAVYLAAFFDWRPYLTSGETGCVVIIAADRRQAGIIFRYVRAMIREVPMLAPLIVRETKESIELSTGIAIEVMTASYKSVRGYTAVCVLGDEAAFWQNDEFSADPDTEILNALKPAMATIPGSMMLVASSPYSRRGVVWRDFRRLWGQDAPNEVCWKASTRTMNPRIPESFIQAELEKDQASATAEYLAEFRSDIEAFIAREAIEAVVVNGRHELPPSHGRPYVFGLDPSGGAGQDSMVLVGAFRDGDMVVQAVIREWKPRFSPDQVAEEASALIKRYGARKCFSDRYGGDWVASSFRAHGISVEYNQKSASELFIEVLPLLNSGKVELLDHPRLIAQLCALERRNTRSTARPLIGHPPGGHDDIACATATALVSAKSRAPMIISDEMVRKAYQPTPYSLSRRAGVI